MPPDPIGRLRSFYDELLRRRVLRVAAVYGAAGWAIVEVSATTFPLLHLPEWAATLVLALVLLGFPLAIGLAWAFDLTSGGVTRTGSLDRRSGQPGEAGSVSRDPGATGGIARNAGSASVASSDPAAARGPGRRWAVAAMGIAVLVAGAAVAYRRATGPGDTPPKVMVLPFDNETGDPSLDPLGRMAAEWIANGLVEIPEIDVVPHALLMEALEAALERTEGDGGAVLAEVAEATSADIGVTGAFYERQDALEFHTQVLRVASMEPLAMIDPVRGPVDDPVQGIDSVQIQVMGALAARLAPRVAWELPPAARPPTYRAYLAYGNGLDAWAVGDYALAADWFTEAFNRDTTYLRALMFAWMAYGNAGDRPGADSVEAFLRTRRENLSRYDRYRIDWIDARARGELGTALAIARRATALNPYGTLRLGLGLSLRDTNRPGEAREQFEDWIATSEEAAGWFGLWISYAGILHILGDYEDELAVARREREQLLAGELLLREAEARALVALGDLGTFQRRLVELEALGTEGLTLGRVFRDLGLELRAHGHGGPSRELGERAIDWHDRLPESLRTSREGRELRSDLLYVSERWAAAEELAMALADDADGVDRLEATGRWGAAAARLGNRTTAETALRQLAEFASDPGAPPGRATLLRARIVGLLGDRQRAVELLRQAFASGQAFGLWLHRDMDLEPLRGFPPYEQLVAPRG